MADERDEIRARINLVELVGRRVQLKRSGKNWTGLCPFHDDKNPSFVVSATTGYYRCWSCGEKGDAFTWVMKTQGVDFGEALKTLAQEAGVTLKNRGNPEGPSQKASQLEAMEEALSYFRAQFLKHDAPQRYCEGRDLTTDVLSHWEIGFAPDEGSALTVHLQKKGFALALCKELFLVDTDPSGGFFDKFRGRLMFPIRNERGELVAFGGRVLGSNEPKYINSSDTPLYRKSRVLYGLHHGRETLYKSRKVILTEGYLDVIACHRAGLTNAVASLGTALSEEHAKLIKRWCDAVVVMYDADSAGEKAAARATEVLAAENLSVQVALLPKGQDPDTLLKTLGAKAVQDAAANGMSPLDFRIRSIETRLPPSEPAFWDEVVIALADSHSDLEREAQLTRLAALYPGTRDVIAARRALRAQVIRVRRPTRRADLSPHQSYAAAEVRAQLDRRERVIFFCLLREHRREDAWMALADEDLTITPLGRQLREAICNAFPLRAPEGLPVAWLPLLLDVDAIQILQDLELEMTQSPEPELDGALQELRKTLQRSAIRTLISTESEAGRDLQAINERLRKLKGDPNL